jgi:hypothetical protein
MVLIMATVFELPTVVYMAQALRLESIIAITSLDSTIHRHGFRRVQNHEQITVPLRLLSVRRIVNGCLKLPTINTATVVLSIQRLIMSIVDVHLLKRTSSSRIPKLDPHQSGS